MGFVTGKNVSTLVRTAACAAFVLMAVAGRASAVQSLPEIDPGSMGSALALLAGGITLLAGRRSK